MAYVNENDFSRVISRDDLIEILEEAAEEYPQKSSSQVREEAEKMAEGRINLYLSKRFDMATEFAKTPNDSDRDVTILECYLHFAVYFIHFAINSRDMPDDRQNQFDACIKMLEQIRDGALSISLDPVTNTSGSIAYSANRKFISKPFADAQVLDNDETT